MNVGRILAVLVGALFFSACQEESGEVERLQIEVVNGLGVVELIELLAHPNELTRTRAHLQLREYLIDGVEAPDQAERLTLFYKHAPHACKAGNEAQTLHILGLFAAQEDVSSILVKQCLASSNSRVVATALEVAHFSDNRLDEELLAFEPGEGILPSYKFALRKLGTSEAKARLAEFD